MIRSNTQNTISIVLSWLSTHGFVLNNREKAGLVWFVILAAFVLTKSDVRSSMADVLEMAFTPKIATVWIIYTVWILLFVWITDRVGIWLTVLTKDTFVWSASAGIVLLLGFTEATRPGYFRQSFPK